MEARKLIESIVLEVLHTMQVEESKPKVLFIFCDSQAHEAFVDQFITLKNQGINHDLLFLDGETSSWLGKQQIECAAPGKVIALDEYAPAPLELPKAYAGVIIPEIDLDNAARVVTGSKGTIKAEIIFSALVLQKFILIGEDIPGLKRSDRRCLQTLTLPIPYQHLFKRHLQQMQELGIEFKPQKDLAKAIIKKLNTKKQLDLSGTDREVHDEHLFFQGNLITASWVHSQSEFPDQTLYLRQGVIISPLAMDLLREKEVTIQYVR